jgi:hypothetical protein
LIQQSAFAGQPILNGEVRPAGFALGITAEIGVPLRVQASQALPAGWGDLAIFTNAHPSTTVLDTNVTAVPRRFYRVVSP